MLVTEVVLGLYCAFPLHKWLLCTTIRLILSSSMKVWIVVCTGGACLLYQGLTRLQANVNDNDTEKEKEQQEKDEDEGEEEEEEEDRAHSGGDEDEEENDSATDEDSSAWMTVNDSEED